MYKVVDKSTMQAVCVYKHKVWGADKPVTDVVPSLLIHMSLQTLTVEDQDLRNSQDRVMQEATLFRENSSEIVSKLIWASLSL